MKVNQITIEGFRGFEEKVTIDLHPQVNVFVGVNGSGKTTVLDIMAKLLDVFIKNLFSENLDARQNLINNTDINYKLEETTNSITIDSAYTWEVSKEKNKDIEFKKTQNSSIKISRYSLPIIAYYSTNRLFIDQHQQIYTSKPNMSPVFPIYEYSLDGKINNFQDFETWYIDKENKENRTRLREDVNYRDPELEYLRNAIQTFFQNIDTNAPYGNLYVDDIEKIPKLFIKKGDIDLKLAKLSDGEKVLILLICDIVRKIMLAQWESSPSHNEILANTGIVLIDEIELHLHPAWQRNVVSALTATFPNIQFIITTHSPQIIRNLKRENIHVIEDFKLVKDISPTYGEDTNTILWEIFGVKKQADYAEKAFSHFYRLLEDDATKAKEALQKLEEVYGTEHTQVKKAKLDYEFEFGQYSSES